MPFDSTEGVAYGTDASTPELWARDAFIAWLLSVLNDPQGPYYSQLHLSPQRLAVVTANRKIARTAASSKISPPVVMVHKAMVEDWMPSGRKIGGTIYEGKRYDFSLMLDMGVVDATPGEVDPLKEESDDDLLAALVRDAVRGGYNELTQRGLYHPTLVQDESAGRNPHVFTCFLLTLDSWTP